MNMLYVEDIINKLKNGTSNDYDDLNAPWKDDLDWTEVEAATNGDELPFKYEYDDPYEDAISGEQMQTLVGIMLILIERRSGHDSSRTY